MEIKIDGLDKLFKKLDAATSAKVLNKAMVDLGSKIQEAAKDAAPVDTGNLRGYIDVVSPAPDTVLVVTNADSVDYAVYVEYGTGLKGDPEVEHTTKDYWRYRGKGGEWFTSHGNEPQPFMRPAFARYKDKASEFVKKALEDEIKGMS